MWNADLSQINQRRAAEACVHMLSAGMIPEATEELCYLDTICARFKAGLGSELVQWLGQGLMMMRESNNACDESEITRMVHYRRWLVKDTSTIQNNHRLLLTTAVAQPKSSIVRHIAEKIVIERTEQAMVLMREQTSTEDRSDTGKNRMLTVGCRMMGGNGDFDAVLAELSGHSRQVLSVAWSPDNKKLASVGDETVRIWDVSTSSLLTTLDGHRCWIEPVGWTIDGRYVPVWCVCWSPDGSKLVSGGGDMTVKMWDVTAGSLISSLEGRMRSLIYRYHFPSPVQ